MQNDAMPENAMEPQEMTVNHADAVGIQFFSGLSAAGSGGDALRRQLSQSESSSLTQRSDLIADRAVWVGAYQGELRSDLPVELAHLDSRNLRFALTALAQIETELRDYVAQFDPARLAIVLGTSTSGIADNEPLLQAQFQGHAETPIYQQKQEMGSLARSLQTYLGWQGPAYTISTACSSAAKAFAAGQRLINAGLADAVLVGGVDTLCRLTLNGFNSLESLAAEICQPCGAQRDGINIGEAAGLFLLSKAPTTVMLLSAGESMDAWHISAPHPEGQGAATAMQRALAQANLAASAIDYLNLHGTATPQNDAMEIRAVRTVFADQSPALSSTKHQTGHCLGAAGAIEALICTQLLIDQDWLPVHHIGPIDSTLADQHYVQSAQPNQPIRYVMSNSFAFGGSNISLIFARSAV